MRVALAFFLLAIVACGQSTSKPKREFTPPPTLVDRLPDSHGEFDVSTTKDPRHYTFGHHNGRYWATLGILEKIGYITGAMEASHFREGRNIIPSSLNVGEIIEELDLFYQEAANRQIPTYYAIYYVGAKAMGARSSDLGELLSAMRKISAAAEK